MKKYLAIAALLFVSNIYAASDAAMEAEKLLELSGTKAAMDQMTDMLLAQQLKQNPALVPFENVMRQFFQRYLSYESVKDEYVSIYTEAFTKNELVAMNEFYSTEVGKKAVRTLPDLMQKGGEIGVRRVQDNMPELQRMIAEEAARLKKEQQQ